MYYRYLHVIYAHGCNFSNKAHPASVNELLSVEPHLFSQVTKQTESHRTHVTVTTGLDEHITIHVHTAMLAMPLTNGLCIHWFSMRPQLYTAQELWKLKELKVSDSVFGRHTCRFNPG